MAGAWPGHAQGIPPNRATRADPMHPKRPSPNPVSRSCFGGIFQHAASLFLAGFGTASPPLQVDALRVADAPWFSKAETVIGSFAGRLQAVGRVRWHRGWSTRLAFLAESSWPLGGSAPFDVLRACRTTTRSQTGQMRASLTAPLRALAAATSARQRRLGMVVAKRGGGAARYHPSAWSLARPPFLLEAIYGGLKYNVWQTQYSVQNAEYRVQHRVVARNVHLSNAHTMAACCRAFSFWRVSRNTDNPGFP